MSEKLARFMLGINAAVAEREPHERRPFLIAMLAGTRWREIRDEMRAYERGQADWRRARLFIELKLSLLIEQDAKAEASA